MLILLHVVIVTNVHLELVSGVASNFVRANAAFVLSLHETFVLLGLSLASRVADVVQLLLLRNRLGKVFIVSGTKILSQTTSLASLISIGTIHGTLSTYKLPLG